MSRRKGSLTVIAALPLACSAPRADEQPAWLVAPSVEVRAELARIVAEAAGSDSVTLAADALTRDSVLTLERREPGGLAGRVATGRTLEAPLQLRLVQRGTRCWLVRVADAREWALRSARCAPAANR